MTGQRLGLENALIPALILCGMMALSVALGPDASWDLRNYHLYNPFALLRKPPGTDLLAAQLQSFLPPGPDIPSYWLRLRLNTRPMLLDAILGLPAAIGAVIAYATGLLLLPSGRRWPVALLAAAYGATGAAGLPTIGTTASEMPAGCFVLGGLYVLLRGVDRPERRNPAVGGALLGVAVAIKLTAAPFAIGAAAAYLVCLRGTAGRRAAQALTLAASGVAGALLVGGWWWLHLYQLTGNPIFPYFNNIFHSPLSAPIAMEDTRFLPRGLGQTLAYPFYWGFEKNRRVTELVMRDPRIALAFIALLAYAATAWRCTDRTGLCLALSVTIGYLLWQAEFSIFRYIAPLEMLSGLVVLLPLRSLFTRRPAAAYAGAIALGVLLLLFTRYPNWGRAYPPTTAASVTMPALPPDSMVLLLADAPLSYVAAFADPAVRFIGVNNNLVHPGAATPLAQQADAAVRGHAGPLFGVDIPGLPQTPGVLAFYGLRQVECRRIESNLDGSLLQLCRLALD